MIKVIEDFKIKIDIKDEKVILPKEIKNNIQSFWSGVLSENPNLWDGDIICVDEFKMEDNEIKIVCRKSNYSHYLYGERIGLPIEYACSSLVAGSILETSDGYYIVGELDENTSYPHCLQLTGGNTDKEDIVNNKIDIMNTIKRETKEELNIDLNDKELIEEYKIKYLDLPDDKIKIYTYIFFIKGKLKITAKEMMGLYENYLNYLRKNNLEIEFEKIHFIDKNNILEELESLSNPKRPYLEKLLLADYKNKI